MTPPRYGAFPIALHWLTALLVVAAFTLGPGGSETRVYSAAKDFDRNLHEALGLTVFALTLLRLVWRAAGGAGPELEVPRWMAVASRSVQGALYVLLLAVPLTAIFGAWLSGHPLTLGILGNIPPPVAESHAFGRQLAKVHEYLGDTILWVAGAHAAAALFHHFILRDTVLLSMLPRWRGRRAD
ncbi:MAG: cytochrome b [Clostridia bacterium]